MKGSPMPSKQISQAQFERLENEWRQIRETASTAPKPSATAPGK
jgi:hypothetical protein